MMSTSRPKSSGAVRRPAHGKRVPKLQPRVTPVVTRRHMKDRGMAPVSRTPVPSPASTPKAHRRVLPLSEVPAAMAPADGRRSAGPSPRSRKPRDDAAARKYRKARTQVEEPEEKWAVGPSATTESVPHPAAPTEPSPANAVPRTPAPVRPNPEHVRKVLSRPHPKLDLRRSWFAKRCSSPPHDPLHATLITPNIVVGSKEAAASRAVIDFYGITHVLNASAQVPNYFPDIAVYLHLPLIDSEEENISPHFQRAFKFMDQAFKHNTRVLVHCVAGVSRSVTLAAAYMMFRHKERLFNAMNTIVKKRFIAQPNVAFLLALAEYELEVFGNSSVATVKDKLWSFPDWNRRKRRVPHMDRPPEKCAIM